MKNRLFTLAGALALLAVVGKFYAVPVFAQVRAALTKNIDEKGRIPYIQSGSTNCVNPFCFLNFPAVPAGKRLVLEYVNLTLNSPNGVPLFFISDRAANNTTNYTIGLISQSPPVVTAYSVVNESILAYFETGETPQVLVENANASSPNPLTAVI